MADDKPKEGEGPSTALATTQKSDGPAVRPADEDDGDEEILALARREADNLPFAHFRRRVTRRHLTVFGGSIVGLDALLRLIFEHWGTTLYLPLTISTVVAVILYKGTGGAVAWWHGRSDDVTVLWKALGQKQVLAFARRRAETLNALASEVGRPELVEGIDKLRTALSGALAVRSTLKRRVARIATLLKPYGNNVPAPEKLREQVVSLEKHLLRTEGQIQTVLSGFDILEGRMANLPYAASNGDGIAQELDRLLSEIDEHSTLLKDSAKEAETPPPDPFAGLDPAPKTENAPDKK